MNSLRGDDSVKGKVDLIVKLCQECQSDDELRFLVRSFANTGLRIGLRTKSIEKCTIDYFKNMEEEENPAKRLEEFERNIFGYRIQSLNDSASAGEVKPIYGVPVKAMAGRAAKSPANVLETLGKGVD